MPPIVTPKLPGWADPKMASVTDPLAIQLIRRAASAIGADDPAGQVMGSVGPMPAVSIYPDAAARVGALGAKIGPNLPGTFYHEIRNLPGPIQGSLRKFADMFPRVAAHMEPIAATSQGSAEAAALIPPGKVTQKVPVIYSPEAQRKASFFGEPYAHGLTFHEGTHVAQALGNRDMNELYNAANKLHADPETAYRLDPFEIKAFARGERARDMASGMRPPSPLLQPPGTVIQQLREAATNADTDIDAFRPQIQRASQTILGILNRRAGQP